MCVFSQLDLSIVQAPFFAFLDSEYIVHSTLANPNPNPNLILALALNLTHIYVLLLEIQLSREEGWKWNPIVLHIYFYYDLILFKSYDLSNRFPWFYFKTRINRVLLKIYMS
jgi:hypothetical protein